MRPTTRALPLPERVEQPSRAGSGDGQTNAVPARASPARDPPASFDDLAIAHAEMTA
jgi:hypothetical protein